MLPTGYHNAQVAVLRANRYATVSNAVSVTRLHPQWRQYCTLPLPKKLLCDHHPVLQLSHTVFCAQIWWANWRLSPRFGQWDSFRVPPDCAVLLLVTVWLWVFDCGSLEWISRDKALVPARGSHSGPCLLSHFPDKPNCISQECPGPNPCPAWPLRCLGACCDWPSCQLFTMLLSTVQFGWHSILRGQLWNLVQYILQWEWARGVFLLDYKSQAGSDVFSYHVCLPWFLIGFTCLLSAWVGKYHSGTH